MRVLLKKQNNLRFEHFSIWGVPQRISTPASDAKYYNLQGQPVEHPTRGIYIYNGKKVVVE